MELMFKISEYKALSITFGRNLPWSKSLYFIFGAIIYHDKFMNVEYAKQVFAFFRKKK